MSIQQSLDALPTIDDVPYDDELVEFYKARLALAEKLLTMLCRDVDWYKLPTLTIEARAYLAFREKEQGR